MVMKMDQIFVLNIVSTQQWVFEFDNKESGVN